MTYTYSTGNSASLSMNTIVDATRGIYTSKLNEQLWKQITPIIPTQKDATMSIIEKVKAERREKRERERIETLYLAYEDADFDSWEDGTVIRFTWEPEREDAKTYIYAGVKGGDGRWYLTDSGRYPLTAEHLVDWLVEKNVPPTTIEYFGPSED